MSRILSDVWSGKTDALFRSDIRRSRFQIALDVLHAVGESGQASYVMRTSELNWAQMVRYLSYCMEKGLVERIGKHYHLTLRGERVNELYCELREIVF